MASAMSMKASPVHPPKITTVKALAESTGSSSIPSFYNFTPYLRDEPIAGDAEDSVPIIDISLLVSGTPEEESQIIHQLSKACSDWGCFMNIPPPYGRFSQKLSSYNFQSVSEDARYFFDLLRDDSGGHWLKIKKKTHSTGSAYSIHIAWRGLKAFYDAVSESLNSPNLVGAYKRRIEHKVFEFERSPNTLKLVDNSIWIIVPDTEWTGFRNGLIQMLKVQAEMRLAIWFEDIQTEFRGLQLHGNHFG